jgi:hypothetical protein
VRVGDADDDAGDPGQQELSHAVGVRQSVEGEVKKPKKVREVEPMRATAIVCTRERDQLGRTTAITMFGQVVSMAVARAIRDWLIKAIPEDEA